VSAEVSHLYDGRLYVEPTLTQSLAYLRKRIANSIGGLRHRLDHRLGRRPLMWQLALGKGPTVARGPNMNRHVVDRLLAASAARGIPVQLLASGRATPTDANALQMTRAGVATGLVGIPNRYMHSAVETISLDDADRAADLLAAFCRGLENEIDWAP